MLTKAATWWLRRRKFFVAPPGGSFLYARGCDVTVHGGVDVLSVSDGTKVTFAPGSAIAGHVMTDVVSLKVSRVEVTRQTSAAEDCKVTLRCVSETDRL
jgi:hypothetical protein